MKRSLICLLLSILGFNTSAQTLEKEFLYSFNSTLGRLDPTNIHVNDGFIYRCGYLPSVNKSYIQKLDEFGQMIWSKTIQQACPSKLLDIIVTQNKDILLTGYGCDTTEKILLSRFDQNGNELWTKLYGTTPGRRPMGSRVFETSKKEILVVGYQGPLTQHERYPVILKTDSLGQLLSNNLIERSAGKKVRLHQATLGPKDELYLSVDYTENGKLVPSILKLDTNLTEVWVLKRIGIFSSEITQLAPLANGDLVYAGYHQDSIRSRLVVSRVSDTGSVVWTNTYSAPGYTWVCGLRVMSNNQMMLVAGGEFGNDNVYLVLLDSTGSIQHQRIITNLYMENQNNVTSDSLNLYFQNYDERNSFTSQLVRAHINPGVSCFEDSAVFVSASINLQDTTTQFIYSSPAIELLGVNTIDTVTMVQVEKCHQGTQSVSEKSIMDAIRVYPNPSNGSINIENESIQNQQVDLSVVNSLGQVVYTEQIRNWMSSDQHRLELSLPQGLYILNLITDSQRFSSKLIVE